MHLEEMGWKDVDWTLLSENMAKWRVVVIRAVNCGSLVRGVMWRHGVLRSRRFEETYCILL